MNAVIARTNEEAAGLGANSLLLEGVGDTQAGGVGSGVASTNTNGNGAYGVRSLGRRLP